MKKILIIILLALTACTRRPPHISVWGWECVTPESDTLMVGIEEGLYNRIPMTELDSMVDNLGNLAAVASGWERNALLTRWHFWRSVDIGKHISSDSMKAELEMAFATADSSLRPYEYHRLRTRRTHLLQDDGRFQMKEILKNYDFYLENGYHHMAATSAMVIANALCEAGDLTTAIKWYNTGDSLFIISGHDKARMTYRINYATILSRYGREKEARAVFKELLGDTTGSLTYLDRNVLLRNTYILTRDLSYLREAYAGADTVNASLAGLYEAMLGQWFIENESPDSASKYVEMSRRHIGDADNLFHKSYIYLVASNYDLMRGDSASAFENLATHIELHDSAEAGREKSQILKYQGAHELQTVELEKLSVRRLGQIRLLIMLLFFTLIAMFAVWWYQRRRRHFEVERERARLEVEHERLHVETASVAVAETQKLTSAVMNELNTLGNGTGLSVADRRRVEALLRDHAWRRDELERVSMILEQTCPRFADNLRKACPDLTEAQVKLAGYILIGLGNKEIAGFLNVRPESVRQARWRLKMRLGVAEDSSLEETLRRFNVS